MEKIILILLTLFMIPIVYAQGFGQCYFGLYPFGDCTIAEEEPTEGEGTPAGGGEHIAIPSGPPKYETVKRYDVSIDLNKHTYQLNETVKLKITIENMGDMPDEDTVLIIWLSNPINKKFGETREQFLEIPIGRTVFEREIKLPENELTGEWRAYINYFTSIQPTIEAYKSFTVKEEITFMDKVTEITTKNPIPIIIVAVVVFIIIQQIYRREHLEKKDEGRNIQR